MLLSTISDRKLQELELEKFRLLEKDKQFELDKQEKERQLELEKLRLNHELELARIQAQNHNVSNSGSETVGSKKKFNLPKLEFRQFGDTLKDWLPFWSQFEHIDKDDDIAPENKFQYLIQATVVGSRAREVVESFPPTGANYAKAVESLKTRFGREDLLVEVYVRELLKLIISVQSKERLTLTSLYDKLESFLRALETLGVTTDKCASILYPMVESCFSEEFLKVWNRSSSYSTAKDSTERLNNLMVFLKTEVEGEERISLAMTGFGLAKDEGANTFKKKKYDVEKSRERMPTASALFSSTRISENTKSSCIFCEGKHSSSDCFKAQKMTLEDRQRIIRYKHCCYTCLAPGHTAKRCRVILRCVICGKKHIPLMCDILETRVKNQNKVSEKSQNDVILSKSPNETNISKSPSDVSLSNFNLNPKVFLQTLKAKLLSDNKEKNVRVLLDTGSQKSYILKQLAEEMKYSPIREEKVRHSLFGGITKEYKHNCYRIKLRHLNRNFTCNFEVFDQSTICENVNPVCKGPWIKELKELGIVLSDVSDDFESVQVLIGADIIGKLLTGNRKVLSSGLVAIETILGWTLMGKAPIMDTPKEHVAMTVTSLFAKEAEIADLWRLDLIGIKDPIEKKSKLEQDLRIREHFQETVRFTNDGRYEVQLPWSEDSSPLPDNLNLAKKRLQITTSKLVSGGLFKKYEDILHGWLNEKIIEEVPKTEVNSYGNYLPHRPVIKESSSTTPIRPVFDASAKMQNYPSLNQCLQSGPNLIELIPDLILRFREKKLGVTADIRKAFLQISVCKGDRDFLRFLWWENLEQKILKVFRHTRVVFGVKSSPFLLESVIEYHIENSENLDEDFKNKLQLSFYVDNVVTSVDSHEQLKEFISKSSELMLKGGFDLRGWEYTRDENSIVQGLETPILGLRWNRQLDTLKVNMDWLNEVNIEHITKRVMLSVAQRVFDPIGFTSPVMLCPKLMLRETWQTGISWDVEVEENLRKKFLQWFHELKYLEQIFIPRWIHVTPDDFKYCSIHTFCDASKDAYAATVFLRLEKKGNVELFLLAARSRIAPLRGGTIPRLELLAALVGARLTNSVVEALGWKDIECYYWSDSTTVLIWISRDENWSVFVRNRVEEIRRLSSPSAWHHVCGDMNPADLPSRGCKAKQLVSLRWWEGPQWLKEHSDYWQYENLSCEKINEVEVENEKLKSTKSMSNVDNALDKDRLYTYFSNYEQIVRVIGWILRFKNNALLRNEERTKGTLTSLEYQKAEMKLIKLIQRESFEGNDDKRIKCLATYTDEEGIIHVKTQIIYRKDEESFKKPVLLPADHEIVLKLIEFYHKNNSHCGLQILQNILREKFWILNARKTIRKVISKCAICKRFSSKRLEINAGPLPEDRVRDAAVFQITGIDAAGPLFLKGNHKAWILLFTCAVYRAVHLELVTSLSTESFLMAFRRFVARRGRCSTIYCDNGTNFVGAANLLRSLDWNKIIKNGVINTIEWKFNPPTASWWGGWWERLIRILKDLLKRVLGKAHLSQEEMMTVLCDCEALMNSRPLTYLSENEVLVAISPSLFLQDIKEWSIPDIDTVDHQSLNRRVKYRQNLQQDLRKRFRSEYLGLLVQKGNCKKDSHEISVGDIVLVGTDKSKRINWPLGRIIELIPGRDGKVRLVRIQTSHSKLLRPIQRVYPLEISSSRDFPVHRVFEEQKEKSDEADSNCEIRQSRYGRTLRIPARFPI